MNKILALFLIPLILSACSPTSKALNASTDPLTSGVKGQTLIGPACPVMTVESPCPDEPYQTKLTVFTLDGQEVMRFASDAEGKFEVNLPPGDYILHPENPEGRPIPSAADVPFTVIPNEFTNIIVTFDSGIR
jgi:hypothetical protein